PTAVLHKMNFEDVFANYQRGRYRNAHQRQDNSQNDPPPRPEFRERCWRRINLLGLLLAWLHRQYDTPAPLPIRDSVACPKLTLSVRDDDERDGCDGTAYVWRSSGDV